MYDNEPLNPRTDYDNFGRMVCWHNRYNLGDEHSFADPNDFLQDLVRRTVSEYALFEFVRSGKAPTKELKFDRSVAVGKSATMTITSKSGIMAIFLRVVWKPVKVG